MQRVKSFSSGEQWEHGGASLGRTAHVAKQREIITEKDALRNLSTAPFPRELIGQGGFLIFKKQESLILIGRRRGRAPIF